MPRYVAFLRGVSPMNARMPELKRCFENAGFTEVRTVLSSGNVVFDSRAMARATLERRAEAAMQQQLGRSFPTLVRSAEALRQMLAADPCAAHEVPAGAKRVVTFLRTAPEAKLSLPIELDGAHILAMEGLEVFTAYVPSPRGPVFMSLIEKTFGNGVTTRTWETVRKCAVA
ncbi:DUF1697 domain-containing protein [Variovorax saccharolyticus]|uniref:DUF1697 domain-containing protein n=1 Tax=Variovorax saccharolyticus TaxID=3053516 RepID=UPI002578C2D1|nr:DUF1697 domain-containing protein [Variovorax sp. J22R187]MDM0020042.1 DUF1697 domain-containing protein [Variovorax sp. J22R187]